MNNYALSRLEIGSEKINQIESVSTSNGMNKILLPGPIDIAHAAIGKISPSMQFSSSQLKTLLGETGITATALSSTNKLNLWLHLLSPTGAMTHGLKAVVEDGAVVPQSLTIPNGGLASLSANVVILSDDGVTDPIAITPNTAITPETGWTKEAYTLGDVTVEGAVLDGIDLVTVDFGVGVDVFGGKVYPTNFNVTSRRPSITFTTFDLDVASAWSLDAKRQASTISIKLDDLPDATARGSAPITLTIYDSVIEYSGISSSQGQKASASVTITPIKDGSNDLIGIAGI